MDLNGIFSAAIRDYVTQLTDPLQLRVVQLEQALEQQGRLLDGALGEIRMLRERGATDAGPVTVATPEQIAAALTNDQLRAMAMQLDLSELLACVDWSEALDYSEIASEIDISELVGEFDPETVAEHIDIESAIGEFFRNNLVRIST
jgi:hypothetical protein